MLCPETEDKDDTEVKFEYKDLVQKENKKGIKITLIFGEAGVGILSPKFKINDSITFQAQYLYIMNDVLAHEQLSVKFTKPVEDSSTYIVNMTSVKLNIHNSQFNIGDNWQIFYSHPATDIGEFDIDITIDQREKTPMTSIMGTSFAPLYDDEELTDFELRGEGGGIRVHRTVLAAASPVLRRMLSGTWKENAEGHVNVSGINIPTLQSFKDYIYLHSLPDTDLEQLLLLASCYLMPDLEQMCVDKLVKSLSVKNARDLIKFAAINNSDPLLLAILKHFENGKLPVKDIEAYMSKDKESDERELEE